MMSDWKTAVPRLQSQEPAKELTILTHFSWLCLAFFFVALIALSGHRANLEEKNEGIFIFFLQEQNAFYSFYPRENENSFSSSVV